MSDNRPANGGSAGVGFVPHTPDDMDRMARAIGLANPEDVFAEIPRELFARPPVLGYSALSQDRVLALARAAASQTRADRPLFLGAGFYDRVVPAALIESILRRTDYYTAYTPYQAEVSQGILQALFEYQSGVCELTGLPVSNASMYDGATALAEAALCVYNASERAEGVFLVSRAVLPHYRAVLKTYLSDLAVEIVEIPFDRATGLTNIAAAPVPAEKKVLAVVGQSPNVFGIVEDMRMMGEAARALGAELIHVFEPTSQAVLSTPGETGAALAVAEGQSLGLPLYYGGLALGIFAASEKFMRRMPGRIVGRTLDADGRDAYCLTLQTREQHIRREKATSNICTNHTLCAIFAGAYLRLLGARGLGELVETASARCDRFVKNVPKGVRPCFENPGLFETAVTATRPLGHLPVYPLKPHYPELGDAYLVSFTERRTAQDVDWLLKELRG